MTILKYIMPSNHKSLIEANPWGCNVKKCLGWNEGIKKGKDIRYIDEGQEYGERDGGRHVWSNERHCVKAMNSATIHLNYA